jgi:YD repeat-containing protein
VKRTAFQRALAALVASSLVLGLSAAALARQGGAATRYVYDEDGRLQAVVAPTGEAAVYEYDPAGNITAVRRLAADALALFSFAPRAGIYGDLVTFVGVGLGAGVVEVSFNGAAARVVGATPTSVGAPVPQGATTGPVTIRTGAGAVTTSTPFTVRGIRVTPSSARLLFGESLQFTAQVVPAPAAGELTWSVNGVAGGDDSFGSITPDGLYTAPRHAVVVLVGATHAALPDTPAAAPVTVRDPDDVSQLQAAAVSVARGLTAGTVVASRPLVVQAGSPSLINDVAAPATSVSYGFVTPSAPLSHALSVGYGAPEGQAATGTSVSVMTGPHIASVAPAQTSPGATLTLTITGRNLSGTNAVRFLKSTGEADFGLAVSNIAVNAEGTVLTATLNVSASAAPGTRVVIVTTPAANSLTANVGSNLFAIVAQ